MNQLCNRSVVHQNKTGIWKLTNYKRKTVFVNIFCCLQKQMQCQIINLTFQLLIF